MLAFCTLADELHFGHAAKTLGVSQPALTQLMQRLEAELDAQLFLRTTRTVRLTQIGETFLEACRRTLAEADRARTSVEDARAGAMGRLVIGCLGAAANGPLPGLVKRFRANNPKRVVEVRHFLDSGAQERALVAEMIDVGFVRSIALEGEIAGIRLLDDPFVVFVPETHRLAHRAIVDLAELDSEPMISWPRSLNPSYFDLILRSCRAAGFQPRVEGLATSLETQLSLVAAGVGVSLQSASNRHVSRTGVVAVDINAEGLVSPLWLIYRRWHRSQLTDLFIQGAQVTGTASGSPPKRSHTDPDEV